MKKILTVLIILLIASECFAIEPWAGDWMQDIRAVSFIVNDVVYAGFSPSEVTSFLPVKNGFNGPIKFSIGTDGKYYSDFFFIYCLASTKDLSVKLRFGDQYTGTVNQSGTIVPGLVTLSKNLTLKNEANKAAPAIAVSLVDYRTNGIASEFTPENNVIDIYAKGTAVSGLGDWAAPTYWCSQPMMLVVKDSDISPDSSGTYNITFYVQIVVEERTKV